jgi:hypothetical protein
MTFHVVTVATDPQRFFPVLVESCKRNGAELEVLGWGTKWQGFAHKFQLMRQFVASTPPNDIVLFVDGYDVLMLESQDEVLRKYHTFARPVVVSCERGTSRLYDYSSQRIFGDRCHGQRINSGCYMGPAKHLVVMFDTMCQQFDCSVGAQDDQQMLTAICHNTDFFLKYVDIDEDQLMFLTGTRSTLLDTTIPLDGEVFRVDHDNHKIIVNYNNQSPSFIHANGRGDLLPIMRIYGLPEIQLEEKAVKTMGLLKHYHQFFIREIVMLSIVLFLILVISYLTYQRSVSKMHAQCNGKDCEAARKLESHTHSLSLT